VGIGDEVRRLSLPCHETRRARALGVSQRLGYVGSLPELVHALRSIQADIQDTLLFVTAIHETVSGKRSFMQMVADRARFSSAKYSLPSTRCARNRASAVMIERIDDYPAQQKQAAHEPAE